MRFGVRIGSIAILGVGFATFLSAMCPGYRLGAKPPTAFSAGRCSGKFGVTQVVAIAAIVFLRRQLPHRGGGRPVPTS